MVTGSGLSVRSRVRLIFIFRNMVTVWVRVRVRD